MFAQIFMLALISPPSSRTFLPNQIFTLPSASSVLRIQMTWRATPPSYDYATARGGEEAREKSPARKFNLGSPKRAPAGRARALRPGLRGPAYNSAAGGLGSPTRPRGGAGGLGSRQGDVASQQPLRTHLNSGPEGHPQPD